MSERATHDRTYRWLALLEGEPTFELEVYTKADDELWLAAACQLVAALIARDPSLRDDLGWDDETYAVDQMHADGWSLVRLDADRPVLRRGDAAPPEEVYDRPMEGPSVLLPLDFELPAGWREATFEVQSARYGRVALSEADAQAEYSEEVRGRLEAVAMVAGDDLVRTHAPEEWLGSSLQDDETGDLVWDVS